MKETSKETRKETRKEGRETEKLALSGASYRSFCTGFSRKVLHELP